MYESETVEMTDTELSGQHSTVNTTPQVSGFPQFPPGTPWWVYLIAVVAPLLTGGGIVGGIQFVSAADVQSDLEEHEEKAAEELSELDDRLNDMNYNILRLCEAQDVKCIKSD